MSVNRQLTHAAGLVFSIPFLPLRFQKHMSVMKLKLDKKIFSVFST